MFDLAPVYRLTEAITVAKVTAKLKKPEAALTKQVARAFQEQKKAYLAAFATLEGEFSEALEDAKLDSLFDRACKPASLRLAEIIQTGFQAVTLLGAKDSIAQYALGFSFNLANPIAKAYLKNYGAEQVTLINDTTKESLRRIILQGAEAGKSYGFIARVIRETFNGFSGAVKGPKHIRSRAELVAVDQLARAYSFGNYAAIQTAQDQGIAFQKQWLTVGDKRVSEGCNRNAAEGWISLDTEHTSGHAYPPRFPGCRCVETYRRDPDAVIAPVAIPSKTFANGEDATKYFKKSPPHKKFNTEEKRDIGYYQSLGYSRFNENLRGYADKPLTPAEQDALDRFSKLFEKTKLADNTTSFRGMLLNTEGARDLINKWEVGKAFKDPGFLSTTMDRAVIKDFGGDTSTRSKYNIPKVAITVRAPAGTRAMYMPLANPERLLKEYELLFDKDQTYRVVSKKEINGNYEIELEILP